MASVCPPGQSLDRVVQVRQKFVRSEIHVGERVDGGAESAHGRRSLETMSDHVAHNEGHLGAGQRDHIEPVAADAVVHVGGAVA